MADIMVEARQFDKSATSGGSARAYQALIEICERGCVVDDMLNAACP
jgi:hypothetical protein